MTHPRRELGRAVAAYAIRHFSDLISRLGCGVDSYGGNALEILEGADLIPENSSTHNLESSEMRKELSR